MGKLQSNYSQPAKKESVQWIMWKDLQDNKWKGPFPLLRRARGAVCFFPQGATQPIWTPERRIRLLAKGDDQQEPTKEPTEPLGDNALDHPETEDYQREEAVNEAQGQLITESE